MTEIEREMAAEKARVLMKQFVMPLTLGDPPRGLVPEDSPLNKLEDDDEGQDGGER